MMSRTRPPDRPAYTPEHERSPSAAASAIHWYTARAKVLLPLAIAVLGMLGFLSLTPAARLSGLEARVAEGTIERRAIRQHVDSVVALLRAEAETNRQLLVGVARLQCLAATSRDVALSGVRCDVMLGRQMYRQPPESP